LTMRDRNRQIFPFSWGLDWIVDRKLRTGDPLGFYEDWSARTLKSSDSFFAPPEITDCSFKDGKLTFFTPTPSAYEENNRFACRLFPTSGAKTAIIVIPQWNAQS
ncbi:MAG: hypothetical protein ACWGQW_17005, partial [bacterium]